jgi:hypothetical protein
MNDPTPRPLEIDIKPERLIKHYAHVRVDVTTTHPWSPRETPKQIHPRPCQSCGLQEPAVLLDFRWRVTA